MGDSALVEGKEEGAEVKHDSSIQNEFYARRFTGAVKSYTFDSKPIGKIKRLRSETAVKEQHLFDEGFGQLEDKTKIGFTSLFES